MDSEEHVCPACGQPVETVVKRHKTLGAWVPVWVAGPCHNPRCAAYVEDGVEAGEEAHRRRFGRTAAARTGGAAAEGGGDAVRHESADAATREGGATAVPEAGGTTGPSAAKKS